MEKWDKDKITDMEGKVPKMQTQGLTNKGHMEGGISRFMSTDTGIQRLRERHPDTGMQRLWDTLKLDHQGSGICKDLRMYRDRNTQILEHRDSCVPRHKDTWTFDHMQRCKDT